MTCIIEAIEPSENIITLYYRHDVIDACKWADFLARKYHVITSVFDEYDYRRLHPEKFYDF